MKSLYRINYHNWKGLHRHLFQSGSGYLVLFLTQGNCHVFLNGKEHSCLANDMLLLKPGEAQTLYTSVPSASCQVISVYLSIEALTRFSEKSCDFCRKFQLAPYDTTIVHPEIEASMSIRNILIKLSSLKEERELLGAEVYEKGLFATFLVLFVRACVERDQAHQIRQKRQLVLDDVFQYISHHLTEELSLKVLEREFFVSGEHISREFKKSTGVTLHSYITKSRIDLAKRYILQGVSIREVYQVCGFGSYNHFFKAFKKECQMTPKEYYRSVAVDGKRELASER